MLAFITWLWNGLKALAGLVLPFAGQAERISSPLVRWGIRVLLLVLLWVGLYFLNDWLRVDTYVPALMRPAAENYLPILALLLLAWVWLGWYLWRLMTEPVESDFPDIDAAWKMATAALAEEGIDLAKTPIFLVLGRPLGGESALVEAAVAPSSRSLRVRGVPRGGPLRVYANDDGAYVTCTGASVLGRLARLLEQAGVPLPAAASPSLGRPGASARGRHDLPDHEDGEERPPTPGTPQSERRSEGGAVGGAAAQDPRTAPRRRHVLRRGGRAGRRLPGPRRGGFGGGRGPAGAPLPPDRPAAAAGPAGQGDAGAAAVGGRGRRRGRRRHRRGLSPRPGGRPRAPRVNCPVFALVCDLETAPGCRELLGDFKPENRKTGRIGRKFPLLPELAGGGRGGGVRLGPGLVLYRRVSDLDLRVLHPGTGGNRVARADHGGQRLRPVPDPGPAAGTAPCFSRILSPVLTTETGEPALFGGCYLAATGNKPDHDQAFIAAVFHRLIEEHKNASWNPLAVREDARQRAQGTWGLAAAPVLLLLLLASVGYGLVHMEW